MKFQNPTEIIDKCKKITKICRKIYLTCRNAKKGIDKREEIVYHINIRIKARQ